MINAKVICDSVSEVGIRITTFEVEYPRIIHAELMTHRMFSRNAASSRAIPFAKMKEQLTGRPSRFGQSNPGMQDKGEDFDALVDCLRPASAWEAAKMDALYWAECFNVAGYHKQVYNRLTEPFQAMKTVITATEWDNFFWLRDDAAADPTIAELARCMRVARDESVPKLLKIGEYHLPYVKTYRSDYGDIMYVTTPEDERTTDAKDFLTVEDAIKVSCARSAAVSFRNVDYGVDKCIEVYNRLVGDERKHASALEHQATPMYNYSGKTFGRTNDPRIPSTWQNGISHADKNGQLWSGNFRGYIQFRKTLAGENYTGA